MTQYEEVLRELAILKRRVCCNASYNGVSVQDGDGVEDTFIITHGLTGVTGDSFVNVIPKSVDATAIAFDAVVDSVNITITYVSPPDAGTDNLKWVWLIKP